jgi:hypothetical protein
MELRFPTVLATARLNRVHKNPEPTSELWATKGDIEASSILRTNKYYAPQYDVTRPGDDAPSVSIPLDHRKFNYFTSKKYICISNFYVAYGTLSPYRLAMFKYRLRSYFNDLSKIVRTKVLKISYNLIAILIYLHNSNILSSYITSNTGIIS